MSEIKNINDFREKDNEIDELRKIIYFSLKERIKRFFNKLWRK